ncbi:MAG TPA: hypothetical protein VF482_09775 [Trebonia sp.]
MELRIRVPRVPAGLGANLLGLLGLVAVAVAVGGLTGNWWWSILTGGAFAFGLAWVAQHSPADAVATAPARAVEGDDEDATQAAIAADVAYMRGRRPA